MSSLPHSALPTGTFSWPVYLYRQPNDTRLTVAPLAEDELPVFAETAALAFQDSGSEMSRLIEPVELRPDPATRWRRSANRFRFFHQSDGEVFLKAMDREGKTLGVAWWTKPGSKAGDPPKKAEADKTEEDKAAERAFDFELMGRFIQASSVAKEKVLGSEPVYYLKMLVTHPDHQRKKVGDTVRLLCALCLRDADNLRHSS